MANLTLLGKMSRMAMANNFCIKMWQSWDFNPTNLRSFNCIRLLIFKEYPCGTLTRCKHWQKLNFSFLDKVWQAGGKYIFYHQTLDVTTIVYPSQLDLNEYSNHLSSCLNVRKHSNDTITYIFLHMHNINTMSNVKITPVRKTKKMDLFFHLQLWLLSFFWVFPNTVFRCWTCWYTCSPVNGISAISCSWLPLKAFFSRL